MDFSVSALLGLFAHAVGKLVHPGGKSGQKPELDFSPLDEGEVRMNIGDQFTRLHPTDTEIGASLETLEQAPDSHLTLEDHQRWLQCYVVPGEGYVLEWSAPPETELRRAEAYLDRERVRQALVDFNAGRETWMNRFTWLNVGPPPISEMEFVELGVFPPADARKLIDALAEAEIEFNMKQNCSSHFRFVVSGADHEAAEQVMVETLNFVV